MENRSVILKKKVGILGMQRIVNYGSFLQAFGLKKTIEELGFDVQFVDYKYEKNIVEVFKEKSFIQKVFQNINVLKFLEKKVVFHKFKEKYNSEYLKLLGVLGENYNPDIDALVIGSDEVFNCMQGYPVGYSRELFGKNYEDIDVISYAASFGHAKLEELERFGVNKEIGTMLNKFKSVSVRDENSYDIVRNLTGKESLIHFDPVLISSYDEYITNNVNMKDYIVLYAYTGRLSKDEEKYIKKFAKTNGKKIVSLGMYQKIADYNLVVTPFEVLEYVKKADYVITDTFHGTIFSVINHAKFCTIIRESNKNKLGYLLEELKLKSRMVDTLDDISKLYGEDVDYTETDAIIDLEKERTRKYLKNQLL